MQVVGVIGVHIYKEEAGRKKKITLVWETPPSPNKPGLSVAVD